MPLNPTLEPMPGTWPPKHVTVDFPLLVETLYTRALTLERGQDHYLYVKVTMWSQHVLFSE